MLGYVIPEKPELKMKEFELYQAYYCGICKSIGKRFGQLERLTLSYDSVFLALILAGVSLCEEQVKTWRCLLNPLKKRNIVYNSKAVDYAADVMLILAYYKMKDDYIDEKKILAALGSTLMKRTFRKLLKLRPQQCAETEQKMQELDLLEKEQIAALDPAAEPFAKLMEEVFDSSEFFTEKMAEKRLSSRRLGYHLGKWIYLIDAYDDIEDNVKTGAYNPLLLQFHYDQKDQEQNKTPQQFKIEIRERIEFNLLRYLAEIADAYQSLELTKNKGLIENIIYFGLHKKTEDVLYFDKKTEDGDNTK